MRAISEIAEEIMKIWSKPDFTAKPYLKAMRRLQDCNERYGLDYGGSIVVYFLANAKNWRGADARRIKAELRAMLKEQTGEIV